MSLANTHYDIFRITMDSLIKETQADNIHSIIAVADSTGKILYIRGAQKAPKCFHSVAKFLHRSCVKQYLQNISLGISGIYNGCNSDTEIVTVQYRASGVLECGVIDFSGKNYNSLNKYRKQLESKRDYLENFRLRNSLSLEGLVFSKFFDKRLKSVISIHNFLALRQKAARTKDNANDTVIELCDFLKTIKNYALKLVNLNIKINSPKKVFASVPKDYVQALLYQTAMFVKFSNNHRLNISVKVSKGIAELNFSCQMSKTGFSKMLFSAVSGILSSFSFKTEFTNDNDLFIAKTHLPMPDETATILNDYGENKIYINELLSTDTTEDVFRFICEV